MKNEGLIPARDPKQCGGSRRIKQYNVADDDDNDDDADDDDDGYHDTAQIGPKNADIHFVRAWAVEMHVKISQEPLYTEIYR